MVHSSKNTTALIVDDSLTQAIQLRMRMTRFGFEARTAANGVIALEEVRRDVPTVVLTDLQMPEMDGLELVKRLKQDFPGLPVILMTAHGSEEIAVEALRSGAASYIPKKNLDRDLARTLEGVLTLSRSTAPSQLASSCMVEAMRRYELANQPELIPAVIARLQEDLKRLKLFDATDEMRIAMALREALMNAIEHGNLEMSSGMRENDDDSYARLVAERSRQAPYAQRRVDLVARESASEIAFTIRDEGAGFDPADLPDPTDPENMERASGRGLLLIRSFMDEVSFNDRGNQITMTKRHAGPAIAA